MPFRVRDSAARKKYVRSMSDFPSSFPLYVGFSFQLSKVHVAILVHQLKDTAPADIPAYQGDYLLFTHARKNTCCILGWAPVSGSISMTITSFMYSFHLSTTELAA